MTAVTELLTHCKKMISEGHQIDTQGLVHWIEDKLLDLEEQQIIDFAYKISNDLAYGSKKVIEEMYNKTFKNTEK